jgi:flagellar capping protein FliD
VNRQNSFLRMFLAESSHLPAQVRRAGGYARVLGQDVSLKVTVLPGGTPVAVAGSARTRHRRPDGGLAVLEELAYVSALRRFLVSSAPVALGAGRQTFPPIARNTDSPLSALQVLADRRLAARLLPRPGTGLLRSASPGALNAAADALGRIADVLSGLRSAFEPLAEKSAFTRFRAESSSPLFLEARTTGVPQAGTYEVEVVSDARGHTVRSAQMPSGPLGLSGAFTLNGTSVAVEAGDSLFDLVAPVNRGEDLDGNGELGAGEDANGNYRLDGGTAEHGVLASFRDGRLTLRSLNAAAGDIKVTDGDGILAAIGLVGQETPGQLSFANEVSSPRSAVVRVDGREFSSGDGVFATAIPGVELRVTGVPDSELRVTVDDGTAGIVSRVRDAVEEYNFALRRANAEMLATGGLLAGDPAATRVRAELARAVLAPVEKQPSDMDEAAEAGLERAARRRAGLSEEGLAAAADSRTVPALRGLHGLVTAFNALHGLGITAAEDDTLKLDEERLASALSRRPDEVGGLFARPKDDAPGGSLEGGIAVRVVDRLRTALGESGLLELRRRALEWLAERNPAEEFGRAMREREASLALLDLLPRVAG